MTDKSSKSLAERDEIDSFLKQVDRMSSPVGGANGRLIFALDATASRQPTWNQAAQLQRQMFTSTAGIGNLDLQLAYFRGHRECRTSPWIKSADQLARLMGKIQCLAGTTQIERILRHALSETREQPVHAVVFVGDAMEENIDQLGNLAGELKLLNLPLFLFQEGFDPIASNAFAQLARLSGGAHCRFDQSAAAQLGQLLSAVAVYATGGRSALERLADQSKAVKALLEQLD